MKAKKASQASDLEDVPNIGKSIANDLRKIKIFKPNQLKGKDAFLLYHQLNHLTGLQHDPCVMDVFMAAIDFMNGGRAKPWWHFTQKRKKLMSKM